MTETGNFGADQPRTRTDTPGTDAAQKGRHGVGETRNSGPIDQKAGDDVPRGTAHDAGAKAKADHLREAYLASQNSGHDSPQRHSGNPVRQQDTTLPTSQRDAANTPLLKHEPGSQAGHHDIRDAVRDAKGINSDLAVHRHADAPKVRAAKGLPGTDFHSSHHGPTSALRDTAGYLRSEALTTLLNEKTHHAFDKHWQDVFRKLAHSGRTEMTVQELYHRVSQAIRNLPDERRPDPLITAKAKGAMEHALHRELYGHGKGELGKGGELGLKPTDMVRMPYAKGPMGSGPADKLEHAPDYLGPRTADKGPPVNESGEVIGSKAEGHAARMKAQETGLASHADAHPGQPASAEVPLPGSRPAASGLGEAKTPVTPDHSTAPHATNEHAGSMHGAPGRPEGELGPSGPALRSLSRGAEALGRAAEVVGRMAEGVQAGKDVLDIVAHERPELLREGMRVPLMMPSRLGPAFSYPSGYTVGKEHGSVIYHDEKGNEVPRDEAIKKSEIYKEDYDKRISI